jgi:hypothetical protein
MWFVLFLVRYLPIYRVNNNVHSLPKTAFRLVPIFLAAEGDNKRRAAKAVRAIV